MGTVPALTNDQRREAIQKAVQYRVDRAELRRQLRCGAATISTVRDVVQTLPDSPAARMRPIDLLTALPGIGEVKAREIIATARIRPQRRLRGLGYKQWRTLINATSVCRTEPMTSPDTDVPAGVS
ncbi:integration host factor, actinobacterial type [Amycolatopsis sp. DSM 110486]|uniref:integration host factor, actinobacterial type n=1 Tax=Amycolatopsis sp. DSM 110486 TaxID=2865832 RepID=UPI001C6A12F4|nr:integration host factor, actinobacterial type [Amycolatopsis sp. DSM 110486]QYN17576.1 integration host factor [Amycolatopsis sp. DSM 110486]